MDAMIEIPRQKWTELRDLFRTNWPRGAVASCFLDSLITYPAVSEAFNVKVYCPEGKMTNGMIATLDATTGDSKNEHSQISIHSVNENTKAIEEALLRTTKIDWNIDKLIPSANIDVINCLKMVKDQIGVDIYYTETESKAIKHLLARNTKQFENLSCPLNTYVGPLKPQHIEIVDNTWTYHSSLTHKIFEVLMKNDLTYVLYSTEDEPLAWLTVNEAGALNHLFCLEPYRGKGYAEFITKYVVNDLLRKGRDVLAYTVSDNVRPQKLFAKLGFEIIGYDYWVFVNKEK